MAPEQHGTLECQPFTKKALICGFAAMNSTNCWLLVLQLFTVGKKSAYTWMHTVQTCCSKVNFDYSISCYILLLFLYYSLNEHCPSHHHSSLGKQPPVITGPWLLHLSSTFSTQQQKKKKEKENHTAPYRKSTRAFYTLPHPGLPGPVTRFVCFLGLT